MNFKRYLPFLRVSVCTADTSCLASDSQDSDRLRIQGGLVQIQRVCGRSDISLRRSRLHNEDNQDQCLDHIENTSLTYSPDDN